MIRVISVKCKPGKAIRLTDDQERERAVRKALVLKGIPFFMAKTAAKNVRTFIRNGAGQKAAFMSVLMQCENQLKRLKRLS